MTSAEARKIIAEFKNSPSIFDRVHANAKAYFLAEGFLEGMRAKEILDLVEVCYNAKEYLKDHGISLVDDLNEAISAYCKATE